MWPNRVGGIAATCAEAFRPYSPVLANLTGVCYWWGWVPTCGLTALLSASRAAPRGTCRASRSTPLAIAIIVLSSPASTSAASTGSRGSRSRSPCVLGAAWRSSRRSIPVFAGRRRLAPGHDVPPDDPVPRRRSASVTSAMAGLYLIGFAAPAFEAAACHVGETSDPDRNVPRAMFASGGDGRRCTSSCCRWSGSASLGADGRSSGDLATTLGPTFAPLLGGAAQGGGDLVHGLQHVPRHAAAARRRGAHAVAARRGRAAAARCSARRIAHRRAVGRDRCSPPAWRSRSCCSATRSG